MSVSKLKQSLIYKYRKTLTVDQSILILFVNYTREYFESINPLLILPRLYYALRLFNGFKNPLVS